MKKKPTDTRAQIAYGISLMELENIEKAQEIFLAIYNNPTKKIFKNTAIWYLAMTYLKQEDFLKTKEYLTQIQDSDYSKKAKKLLIELEEDN